METIHQATTANAGEGGGSQATPFDVGLIAYHFSQSGTARKSCSTPRKQQISRYGKALIRRPTPMSLARSNWFRPCLRRLSETRGSLSEFERSGVNAVDQEPSVHQSRQMFGTIGPVPFSQDRRQQVRAKSGTQDGRGLQYTLGAQRKQIDTRRQNVLNSVGNRRLFAGSSLFQVGELASTSPAMR